MKRIVLLASLILLTGKHGMAEDNFDFFFNNNSQYADVRIEEVRSAQHFVIINGRNEKEIIRLIGIKAPEPPRIKEVDVERDQYGFPVKPDVELITPIDELAFRFAQELLENKRIRLEFDSTKKNSENQTLAYAFLLEDDIFVNAEILRQGLAQLQIRPPNTKYRRELRAAYQEARQEKRGLQGQ